MPIAPLLPDVDLSVVPRRTADPAEARALVARDGAAVLTGCGTTSDDAVAAAHAVLAGEVVAIPDPAAIHEGREQYGKGPIIDNTMLSPAHTDGFAYGDHYPDHIFLLCARPSPTGGDSFLLDGLGLVDALAAAGAGGEAGSEADADAGELARLLTEVPIEQTEPGFRTSRSTVVQRTASGRRLVRLTPDQRPDPTMAGAEVARQTELLDGWKAMARRLSGTATRFKLGPGDLLCIDNYRCFHGRDPFTSTDRLLYRVWAWTTDGNGVPEGLLHSDQRYAVAEA